MIVSSSGAFSFYKKYYTTDEYGKRKKSAFYDYPRIVHPMYLRRDYICSACVIHHTMVLNSLKDSSMNKFITGIAIGILALMAVLMLGSSWNDSAIMDELPHIPAGYSYLVKQDYRLNPEHPPLIKMLAAVPLLFQKIYFPSDSPHWAHEVNGQWDFGREFLYHSGNNSEQIIFWARIPIMLLALGAAWLIFAFTRKRFGDRASLLTLTLFAFSPTVLAHSRFVTTDLGALFAFLIGIFSLVMFLEQPTWKNAIYAGIAFGIAQLLKFSLVLLIPMYVIILGVWFYGQSKKFRVDYEASMALRPWSSAKADKNLIGKVLAIFAIGILVIWPLYQYAVWKYPPERQKYDTEFILTSFAHSPASLKDACGSLSRLSRCPAELVIWASDKPILRPYAEYLLGVLMVFQRQAGGNTAYFLGEVTNIGSRAYFPVSYLLKEPIPILMLVIVALSLAICRMRNFNQWSRKAFVRWANDHPLEWSSLIMILVYWAASMKSPLNIGLRHVMPTFPFIYLLTAKEIDRWMVALQFKPQASWILWMREIAKNIFRQASKYLFIYCLLLWLIIETILVAPSYLAYYNELVGGTKEGYIYIVDSNYDWGQDLKRLTMFVKQKGIEKIAVDYFGGGDPGYYLGKTFEPWWSAKGPLRGWFAISATFRQGAFGKTIDGFIRKPEDEYMWLKPYEPVGKAGDSIFLYNLP